MITPGGRPGDSSPLGHKGSKRKLDDYVRAVAHALMRKGYAKGHAIAVAKNSLKRWSRGGGHVRPQVRAGAAAHLAAQKAIDKSLTAPGHFRLVDLAFEPLGSAQDGPRGTIPSMGRLTARRRKNLPKSSFAVPGKRKYPIPDKGHAANALARVAANGTPAEKAQVARAVKSKYPAMAKGSRSQVIKALAKRRQKSLTSPREALEAAIGAKARELNLTISHEPGQFEQDPALDRRIQLAQEIAARRLAAQDQ